MSLDISDKAVVDALFNLKDKGQVRGSAVRVPSDRV
jgi:hypothetical protein